MPPSLYAPCLFLALRRSQGERQAQQQPDPSHGYLPTGVAFLGISHLARSRAKGASLE